MKKFILLLMALLFLGTAAAENATEVQMGVAIASWQCEVCAAENTGNFCGSCGAEKNVWLCGECAQENNTEYCTYCGKRRVKPECQIIANFGTLEEPDYRVVATFYPPEGYTLIPEVSVDYRDPGMQEVWYEADHENAVVNSIVVSGWANVTAQESMENCLRNMSYLPEGYYAYRGGPKTTRINDREVHYEYEIHNVQTEEYSGKRAEIFMYMDAGEAVTLYIGVFGRETESDRVPTQEEFLAEAEKILELLEIEE